MTRPISEWLAIALDIKALYDSVYQQANADGKITFAETIDLLLKILEVFNKHQVTLDELGELVRKLEPLLKLFKR